MAKLKLTLPVGEVAVTGKQVSFVAPCDSAGLTHLIIENFEFELVDSNGNNLLDGAFKNEAMVSVILNVESAKAFIQNADINYQLKQSFDKKVDLAIAVVNDEPTRVKEVPDTSSPYAEILRIGGMTRKCTNLIPKPSSSAQNGVTFTVNDNGSVTAVGTASPTTASMNIGWIPIKAGKTYTVSSGLTGSSGSTFQMWARFENGSNHELYSIEKGTTFTSDKDDRLFIQLYVYTGNTVNLTLYPMLNEGSVALPHEPYFEGLRSAPVTEVESVGVNLITAQAVYGGAHSYTEMVVDGRNCARITSGSVLKSQFVFKPNTQYTVSFYAKGENYNGATANNSCFAFYYEDGTFNTIYNYLTETSWTKKTLTSTAGKTVIAVGVSSNEWRQYTYIDIDTFMFNEGTEALPYSPYQHNTIPIPKEVQALDGYGWGLNESVYNYIDYEKKQFVKRVGKVDMGSLAWDYIGASQVWRTQSLNGVCVDGVGLCEKYEHIGTTDVYVQADKTMQNRGNIIYLKDLSVTEASQITGMLCYELAEPIVTDISEYLLDNNLKVEAGGTVTMVNEYDYDVPSVVNFTTNNNEIIGADTFVGDLKGTAARALSDSEGNEIKDTYLKTAKVLSADSESKCVKDVPEGSAPYAEILQVGGRTRKCTNLIYQTTDNQSLNGVTFTKNADGSITVNGTAAEQAYNTMAVDDLPNGTYTLSLEGANVNAHLYISFIDGTGASVGRGNSHTFTITDTKKYQYCILNVNKGATTSNETYYIMLNKGTEPLPYEPYFEGLRSAPVSSVESVGANLLNPASGDGNVTVSGVTFTRNTDGSININGTATGDIFYDFLLGDNLQPNTSYYASLGSNFVANLNEKVFAVGYIVNGERVYAVWGNEAVFTTPTTFSDVAVRIRAYAGSVFNNITVYPILAKSSIAIPYTPYVEHSFPIPEAVRALDGYGLGIDDTLYNYIDWGKKQFVQRVERYVFTGKEGIDILDGWFKFYFINLLGRKNGGKVISNYYDFSADLIGDKLITCSDSIYIMDSDFTTIEEFRQKLVEWHTEGKPLEILYSLAKPIVTDISDILPDFVLPTENGGTVRMVNEYNYDLPNTVVFYKGDVKHSTFVGTLKGQASHANISNFAVRDSEGNVIKDTYCLAPIVSQTDITAGVTPLAKGQSYHVYE